MARDRASRPKAAALRLFVAFEIPEPAKDAIEEAVVPYREMFPKARWVPRANWHVTVKFLGSTYPRLVPWVKEAVGEAAAGRSIVLTRLTSLGAFPSVRRARVLWAGLDDRPGRLAELALALDSELSREFKPERRPFTPHLTVARSEPPLALPDGFAHAVLRSQEVSVSRLILFRSHLRRPAPVYEPLEEFELR